jgi:hypothetical protein
VDPRVGLDDVEKRKSLTISELRLLGRPTQLPVLVVLRMTRKARGELNKWANLSMSSNKNNC